MKLLSVCVVLLSPLGVLQGQQAALRSNASDALVPRVAESARLLSLRSTRSASDVRTSGRSLRPVVYGALIGGVIGGVVGQMVGGPQSCPLSPDIDCGQPAFGTAGGAAMGMALGAVVGAVVGITRRERSASAILGGPSLNFGNGAVGLGYSRAF